MRVVGLITEYNPFHYGHKYHLEQSLSKSNASHSIAIMSGSFVQRGEPSIVDKWTKAKMAIDNGVDLVIELPFVFSVQSAELFALGAIKILNSLNIVDCISFGSESNDLKALNTIAEVLIKEPSQYKILLNKFLSKGFSFPKSRSSALDSFLNHTINSNYDYKNILQSSNDILGIEYLKALKSLNSKIEPITIQRLGSNYRDHKLSNEYASATSIRKSILNNELPLIKYLVPQSTYGALLEYKSHYNSFNSLNNYNDILKYLILTKTNSNLKEYFDVVEGLENRIIKYTSQSKDIDSLINNISTKRYPKTRIQRIMIHILSDLKGVTIKNLYQSDTPYIRILGSNEKGFQLLRKIKEDSNVHIINKFSNHHLIQDKTSDEFIYYEEKATDIFFLGLDSQYPKVKMDYKTSQYNKKIP